MSVKSRVRRERPDVGVCGRMSRAWPRCARSVFLFVGVTMVDEAQHAMPVSCGGVYLHTRRARGDARGCLCSRAAMMRLYNLEFY